MSESVRVREYYVVEERSADAVILRGKEERFGSPKVARAYIAYLKEVHTNLPYLKYAVKKVRETMDVFDVEEEKEKA